MFKALRFEEKRGSHRKIKKEEKRWLVSSILTKKKKVKVCVNKFFLSRKIY
jgi:hypothetical protein